MLRRCKEHNPRPPCLCVCVLVSGETRRLAGDRHGDAPCQGIREGNGNTLSLAQKGLYCAQNTGSSEYVYTHTHTVQSMYNTGGLLDMATNRPPPIGCKRLACPAPPGCPSWEKADLLFD